MFNAFKCCNTWISQYSANVKKFTFHINKLDSDRNTKNYVKLPQKNADDIG